MVILGNINKIYNSILEFDNQYTENAISLNFNEKLSKEEIIESIMKLKQNKNIVIKFSSHVFDYEQNFIGDYNNEGTFFNYNVTPKYSLIWGRTFNKNDFKEDKNLIVIGKDIVKYTIKENNKTYLLNGNSKFEVIGILGKKDISSMYDDKILYNLEFLFKNKDLLTHDLWAVDSDILSKQELKNLVLKNIKDVDIGESLIGKRPNPLKIAIKENKDLTLGVLGLIFCIFTTLIISILNWLDIIKLEIGIRKCSGALNSNIIFIILNRYLLYSFISFCTSIMIYYLLHIINFAGLFDYNINNINIVISIIVIILIGIITIILSMIKISKIKISKLIRGL